eukprot:CAMPEP_0198237228 /NCGR_PEP_ID=MMETSP1446-20131203/3070_1 /TAXON_ID=1461542 ORGANISM="Unidentified sp, Strain CCMP2111" /NCGR_SAMPLE_ID=MMETSP1446 /ASSEMBLY_ACC=CAM_ASM_001112 /LENGTH=389 /DNA_ID=CAMNT_0043919305 /DNA_START=323 /DNA_END=1492 /DNA_ORIENTATION=-
MPQEREFRIDQGSSPSYRDDIALLQRKGRLKEQDPLIDFMISMHSTHTSQEVMEKVQEWIKEHMNDSRCSKIRTLIPGIGKFHKELDLVGALHEYDAFSSLTKRKFVPANFAELRHILNIAEVHASAPTIKLTSFDADGTLYKDGQHLKNNSAMVELLIGLLQQEVNVAIITAAGYPGQESRFEERFSGLLKAFRDLNLSASVLKRFYVMGGECNYLLKVDRDYRLRFVDRAEWASDALLSFEEGDITALLDNAQDLLLETASTFKLPVQVVRKERAVGIIPSEPAVYEVLEEIALTAKLKLEGMTDLPFCAFNGGADCFVDVGNKGLGLEALTSHLSCSPTRVIHFGDRFTTTGNDAITKRKFPTVWVANPEETAWFIRLLLKDLEKA